MPHLFVIPASSFRHPRAGGDPRLQVKEILEAELGGLGFVWRTHGFLPSQE